MFAGRRRRSSNVKVMQLFYELKQRFPTVPDHIVTSCITSYIRSNDRSKTLSDLLVAALAQEEQMGRSSVQFGAPFLQQEPSRPNTENVARKEEDTPPANLPTIERRRSDMNDTTVVKSAKDETAVKKTKTVSKKTAKTSKGRTSPKGAASESNETSPGIDPNDLVQPANDDDSSHKSNASVEKPLEEPTVDKGNKASPKRDFRDILRSVKRYASPRNTTTKTDDVVKSEVKTVKLLDSETPGKIDENTSDVDRNEGSDVPVPTSSVAKRPNHLDIKPETLNSFDDKKQFNIRLSEKCKDIHKLLNANLSEKPPRSPLTGNKRFTNKNSPTRPSRTSPADEVAKKETCSTPTQTTDTLLGSPNVNLSLNVNCSLDVVQNPQRRRSSVISFTPSQPWLQAPATSPRSYTSVNFTLRPPASTPQDPIDITSHNSSLTYSTSSFDSQKGLQSRLQITVSPTGGGSVSSVRLRPRSLYSPESTQQQDVPARAGSLNDLPAVKSESPVILKQQSRLERLRLELNNEKARLAKVKQEVAALEKNRLRNRSTDKEIEKQLLMEIRHLRSKCKELAYDEESFYSNIYTGPRVPVITDTPPPSPRLRQHLPQQQQYPNIRARRVQYQSPQLSEEEGPKWNCSVCTFLNHPWLNVCEQCNMHRILHGTGAVNPGNTFEMLRKLNTFDVARSVSLNNVENRSFSLNERPIGFVFGQPEQGESDTPRVAPSRSAPNVLERDHVC